MIPNYKKFRSVKNKCGYVLTYINNYLQKHTSLQSQWLSNPRVNV